MRPHISVDDEVVAEQASSEALEAACGSIEDRGHDWDDDPAAWVTAQRADARRTG